MLILGPAGSGKTLMLKRFQMHNFSTKGGLDNLDNPPSTIQTVGTNIVNIIASRRSELMIREVGGCMAPIWHKFYKDSIPVIFVIDSSNRFQIASACVQLLTMMSSCDESIPVAIVFNKMDATTVMSDSEIESVFRLDGVLAANSRKVSVFYVSAKTGKNMNLLLKWIVDNYQEEKSSAESMEA